MTTRNGVGRYVPIQLFEAIFLFALTAVLLVLFFKNNGKKKFPLLPTYAFFYGVWRFLIEFWRGDERGKTIVPFLSPSQLIAVLLIVASIAYFVTWFLQKKKRLSAAEKAEK
jgi:phosphatidylglycerol:prolipoprotein diacylglycerol transferase